MSPQVALTCSGRAFTVDKRELGNYVTEFTDVDMRLLNTSGDRLFAWCPLLEDLYNSAFVV
jgi:hypothetical protein